MSVGLGLVALGFALALVAIALVQERPGWWRPLNPGDPGLKRLGREVENFAMTELTRVRAPEPSTPGVNQPFTLAFTVDQANAWLNAALPDWLENQTEEFRWPPQLAQVQANFHDGTVSVGVLLTDSPVSSASPERAGHVLTATFTPSIDDRGRLWLPAHSVRVGRLPIPTAFIASTDAQAAIRRRLPPDVADAPELAALLDALAGNAPVVDAPVLRLGDGRRVRLVAIAANDERLLLTLRTEPRPVSRP